MPVGIHLWHDGSKGLDAALELETQYIKMDGHRAPVARQIADEERLVLVDDDLAYRATRWAQAGYHLGLGADMVLSCRFPKIDHIKAGEVQEIDWQGDGRRKGRTLALLPGMP